MFLHRHKLGFSSSNMLNSCIPVLNPQDIDIANKLPSEYAEVLSRLPWHWAAWMHRLVQFAADIGPTEVPRLACHGEVPKADVLTSVTADCQQILLLSALLSQNEESKLASSALKALAEADAFLRPDHSDHSKEFQRPVECLQALSNFLTIGELPKCQIMRIDAESLLWPEIELLASHIFRGILPTLDSLLFDAVMENLHPSEWEDQMQRILDSVQEALTTAGVTTIRLLRTHHGCRDHPLLPRSLQKASPRQACERRPGNTG